MAVETLPKLRPLRMSELLDRGVQLYRSNFLKFVGIIAVVQIPTTLLEILFSTLYNASIIQMQQQQLQDPYALRGASGPFGLFSSTYFIAAAGNCLLPIITLVLLRGIAAAALARAVADNYLGQPTGLIDAYRKIGRSWLRLIGALLLAFLFGILLGIWLLVPCAGWLTGLGILFFWGQVIVTLVAPIVVLEQQTAKQSIRRAWDLTRQRFWWVVGFMGILYLFNLLVTSGPTLLINLGLEYLGNVAIGSIDPVTLSIYQTTAQSLVVMLTSLIYLPLQLTCMILMYFDLRVRTEGFDLALQADSTMDQGIGLEDIIAQTPPKERTGLVTWSEMGYFALLSLAAVALGVAIYMTIMGITAAILGVSGGPPGF